MKPPSRGMSPFSCWSRWLIVIWGSVILASILLLVLKKGKSNSILFLCIIGILLSVIIFVFQYEPQALPEKGNPIGKVTLSIRCDVLTEEENRIILSETELVLTEGETVFDILKEATQTYKIHMEYSGSPKLAYIEGIDGLYERDHGGLSGWVYYVNGESPSVSCGSYQLKDGDTIAFHYSLEQGDDIIQP